MICLGWDVDLSRRATFITCERTNTPNVSKISVKNCKQMTQTSSVVFNRNDCIQLVMLNTFSIENS